MFRTNDIVVYKNSEICEVQGIETKPFMGQGSIEYYVLRPVYDDSPAHTTFYVPTDADETRVRSLLTAEELREIVGDRTQEVPWIANAAFRKKTYMEILDAGQPVQLLALMRTLMHQRGEKSGGKKFSEVDERICKAAEKKMYPLFHHVLGVSREEFLTMLDCDA